MISTPRPDARTEDDRRWRCCTTVGGSRWLQPGLRDGSRLAKCPVERPLLDQQHERCPDGADDEEREVAMIWPAPPEEPECAGKRIARSGRCQPQPDHAHRLTGRRKLGDERQTHGSE